MITAEVLMIVKKKMSYIVNQERRENAPGFRRDAADGESNVPHYGRKQLSRVQVNRREADGHAGEGCRHQYQFHDVVVIEWDDQQQADS